MIAQVDRDGNGKISIEGMLLNIHEISLFIFLFVFFVEFAALVERES
jgi:hypothetical protein